MNDIFDVQLSNEEKQFIIKTADLELEVLANIVENTENLPFLGSAIKLGKIGLNLMDLRYIRKIAKFLKEAESLSDEKVQTFLSSLNKKDHKRIAEFLTHVLYTAEEDSKAVIFGRIYKRRVCGDIDNEMLLRLCSIVNRSFVDDLSHLAEYIDDSKTNNILTDNLVTLGILTDVGNLYRQQGVSGIVNMGYGPTKYVLNVIGLTLYHILNDEPITNGVVNGTE